MSGVCGTELGYSRHRRAGEEICPPCRAAHSVARRDRKYGLAPGDWDRMHADQGGRCKICGATPSKPLNVDHDHDTDEVRGLLCGFCNTVLGLSLESPDILRRCVLYLEGNLRSAPTTFLGDLSKKRVDSGQLAA